MIAASLGRTEAGGCPQATAPLEGKGKEGSVVLFPADSASDFCVKEGKAVTCHRDVGKATCRSV